VGVVVDASQQGEHGQALARELVAVVLDAAQGECAPDPAQLSQALRVFHAQSRFRYLQETASYALAVRSSTGAVWALVCGDCRVGLIEPGGAAAQVLWLPPVHTMANALGQTFDGQHARLPQRHLLTRCWNAKRFHQPELLHFEAGGHTLCLATDGFWLERDGLVVLWAALDDDASCLQLGATDAQSAAAPSVASDHDNFQCLVRR
jgi:serine/threonine protein phosphatase PrpC